VIIFEQVTKRHPGGTIAVDDLSLAVPDGEIMILVGPEAAARRPRCAWSTG
jgi:ABC-type multidrug transport system ATPase subunit